LAGEDCVETKRLLKLLESPVSAFKSVTVFVSFIFVEYMSAPRSDAKELEMRGNRAYLIGNFLKLHKKPPVGEQRGRFFRIFAASG